MDDTPVTPQPPCENDKGPTDFLLDIQGFEGPIDLLLSLAKDQKVDLAKISILDLALAYLDFIDKARDLRIELAADYLVMAAWLAYLKSKLLLPPEEGAEEEELSGEALAQALAFQLKRLSALQDCAEKLFDGPLLGRDVLRRGFKNDTTSSKVTMDWQCSLHDVLNAYGEMTRRALEPGEYKPKDYKLHSIQDAIERMGRILGLNRALAKGTSKWKNIASFLPDAVRKAMQNVEGQDHDPLTRRSAIAATLSASLELAKSGRAEIAQAQPFAPIYVRPMKQEISNDE